ncbi:hypothetical protein FKM82_018624 [Ascaphus truei]
MGGGGEKRVCYKGLPTSLLYTRAVDTRSVNVPRLSATLHTNRESIPFGCRSPVSAVIRWNLHPLYTVLPLGKRVLFTLL